MFVDFSHCHAISLPSDLQDKYLWSLSEKRKNGFVVQHRNLANDLERYNIPTAWVAYGQMDDRGFYSNTLRFPGERGGVINASLFKKHKFVSLAIKNSEHVVVKYESSLFLDPWFADFLKTKLKIDTVIVSGMDTNCCVTDTVRDAAKHGFNVFVVYDRLADASQEGRIGGTPSWHRCCLEKNLKNLANRVTFVTAKKLLKSLKEKPALPLKATPVSSSIQQTKNYAAFL